MKSFPLKLVLRIIAILVTIASSIWLIIEPGFEPLVGFLTAIATYLTSSAVEDPSTIEISDSQALRNRKTMLKLVEDAWVKGVLENSLYGEIMIEMEIKLRPEMVERPWDMILRKVEEPDRQLSSNTKIIDVFDEMGGSFLILGEPGSGKTMMLLELARYLITQARDDFTRPIPVVFNLSSWGLKKQSLDEWLIEELRLNYQIPRKIAEAWVEQDELTLLLDGLDEVIPESRDDCVSAINLYRQNALVNIVVCSRTADYEALTHQLKLTGAIVLQNLNAEQIKIYLDSVGEEFLAVQEIIQQDRDFLEVVNTPLMLSVMLLAYRKLPLDKLESNISRLISKDFILSTYIDQMISRRGSNVEISSSQIETWLGWLAKNMTDRSQSLFFIENIQPDWCTKHLEQTNYEISFGLIGSFIIYLCFTLIARVSYFDNSFYPYPWFYSWLSSISASVFFGVIISGLLFGLVGELLGILLISLTVIFYGGIKNLFYLFIRSGLLFSIGGLFFYRFGGWGGKLARANITPVEKLSWSWQESRKGLIVGIFSGMFSGLMINTTFSIIFGLIGGFLFGIVGGIKVTKLSEKTKPNQGMWRSLTNALLIGLFGGLASALLVGLLFLLISGVQSGQYGAVVAGLAGFFLFSFIGGGRALFQHVILRFTLYWNGQIPWNYARFLDQAADFALLRKVGGGYIFIHRLLQEYFASVWNEMQIEDQ